ncbi:MAG: hypothetical protein N3B10_05970 [Armatimonadetes bacterium]|nr:hypothetical protein [Armatimonadota bacterium]MCX7968024.1 hypothetical protein [Armatimonadota bacterium]MDW8142339.1 hypothetical protein [Armatimonadota bacterium]
MLPTHQPLTVKDLSPIGVAATLLGFLGFTVCLWLLVWLGLDKEGKRQRPFKWLAFALVVSFTVMLWGLTKA